MAKIEASDSIAVRYRPKKLDDIVGNKDSLDVLKGMFKERKIVKTLLLAGPTGSGKTTCGRIVAMTINCQNLDGINPCMTCRSCKSALAGNNPDIHELNAAGEEGKVEAIRNFLQLSKLAPKNNYRVFLVDEAQGLTGKSKEEILKPIEEPPPNTIWILSTMNPEKLDKAIYGRCVKLFFSYPMADDVAKMLYKACRKEYPSNITNLLKPHFGLLADGCGCQPRNSLATLEKVANALIGAKVKNPNEDKIKKLIKKYVVASGELDPYVIKFLMHTFYGKRLVPLTVLKMVEGIRSEEFITTVLKYSHYAALFLLSKEADKKMDKTGFYGMDTIRWDSALLESRKKVTSDKALAMCKASTLAIEKIRLNLMPPYYALLYMFQTYLEGVDNG